MNPLTIHTLDRRQHDQPGRPHYEINLEGTRIVYCYVRKNACTAFKNLFLGESRWRWAVRHRKNPGIKLLNGFHKATPEKAATADFQIFIYRDPVERTASLYLNKFVHQRNCEDIFRNYHRLTGRDPESVSFRGLIDHYISRLRDGDAVDCHVWTQASHLMPLNYNTVIPINNLKASIQEILGTRIAEKYFSTPANPSRPSEHVAPEKPLPCIADEPASKLRDLWLSRSSPLNKEQLIDQAAEEKLREAYQADYALIKQIEGVQQ